MIVEAMPAIVELRQYTLFPGQRDVLIALFESTFVVPQDAAGARIVGLFRDLDDPERFVWVRGFASMAARHAALTTFYDSEVWTSNRNAAAATMRDSDNVLLLRPSGRSPPPAAEVQTGAFLVVIYDLRATDVEAFAAHFDAVGAKMLAEAGATATAVFVTESAENTFVRLPVREGERVLVCFARFASVDALDAAIRAIGPANALRGRAPDALLPAFMRRPELLRLVPTEGSAWR